MAESSAGMTEIELTGSSSAPEPQVADEAIARAERIAFLALASELARGRNVLVVDDGASALTGIAAHLDSADLAELGATDDASYQLSVADLTLADETASAAIADLARVVSAEDGVALLRLPNRPEFAPLLADFESRFARSLTLRQHNWVASALLDDAMFANDDPARAIAASVRKMAAAEPGEELYNVIVGAHGAFPEFRPQLAMTRSVLLRELIAELAAERDRTSAALLEVSEENQRQALQIRELEEELAWYDENKLAIRSKVEAGGPAATLLGLWVAFASNIGRLRRVLRG